jgi:hypothetical protein
MKQAIIEPLRPNPRNKRDAIAISARSYRVKRTLSMGCISPPESLRALCYTGVFAACHLTTLDVRVA